MFYQAKLSNFENFSILSLNSKFNNNPFVINIGVKGKAFKVAVDTGASVSVLDSKFCFSKFGKIKLKKDSITLKAYSGNIIKPLGQIEAETQFNGVSKILKYYVVYK